MRLVYAGSGKEVSVGDVVSLRDDVLGLKAEVKYFRKPHKPASSGKVFVRVFGNDREFDAEYFVNVIGATWVEREDRG